MPVTNVGNAVLVETGTVALRSAERSLKLAFSAATLELRFGQAGAHGSVSQGAGPDDFILTLHEPRALTEVYWAGEIEDGGTHFRFTVLARAFPIDQASGMTVHYTISR
jgi:hypothetical protein